MTDGVDIGGRSRRFQAAVIVVTILALLAGALAAATLDSTSPVDIDLGDRGGDGGDIGANGSIDGTSGDGGGSGGGVGLPEFILDIIGGIVDGDQSDDADLRPVDPGEGETPPPPYNITVEPEPTPGTPVVVTVEKNGRPVPFTLVAFNGDRVGVTGPTGQVRARVPYTDELTVTATPPEPDDDSGAGSGSSGEPFALGEPGEPGVPSASGGLGTAPDTGLLGAPAGSGGLTAPGAGLQAGARENASATYDLPTDVAARVDGVALPGKSGTVRFTVAGNPLPGVEVRQNGRRVAITGDNGTADIPVPADAPLAGSVSVSLTRGAFDSEASVEVGDVTADVETGLLALPATGATVELRAVDSTDTEPLEGVPVAVTDGNEQVAGGETGQNGTVSFTLPWTNSVTATGTTNSGVLSAQVTGIFLSLAGLVVALALPLVGVAVWMRQNPATRRRGRERLVGLLLAAGGLLEQTGRWLARVVRSLPVRGGVERLWGGLVGTAVWLRSLLGSGAGLVRDRLVDGARRVRERAWLALVLAGPRWLSGRLRAGLLGLAGLPSRLLGGVTGDTTSAKQSASEDRAEATPGQQQPGAADERLRRCWQWLVRRVVGRGGHRTETPAEIERRAVERGLPAGPVRRLRRAFQEVEYGPADADERVDDARSARESLDQEEDGETDD